MDWLDLLAVQGTLKSLLQHHSSKASILQCSAFFTVQLSHSYMTTGKTTALTRWTFVGKVMSLLFNMLSRLVIIFLPRTTTCKRMKLEHILTPYTKINSKWIKDLNVRPETIKHISKTLSDINHSRILYDLPPREMEIKAKINKWDLIKLKTFAQ